MGTIVADMVAGGRRAEKSNAERLATALNSLLNQLTRGPDFDVAVIGYQTDAADQVHVGSRWGGALSGREFVSTAELAAAPLRVETRTRRVNAPGGIGPSSEEAVEFPVWYAPTPGVKAPQIAAYRYCRDLLARWLAENGSAQGVPLVIHVTAGASGDGNPQKAVEELLQLSTPGGPPLLLQAHLASSPEVMSSLYPSSHIYLTLGSARDMFRRVSVLPPHLAAALKQAKVPVNPGACGLLYNAKIADVIRMFGLVTAHTKDWPSKGAAEIPVPEAVLQTPDEATPPTTPTTPADDDLTLAESSTLTENAGIIVLLLDRSVEDPFGGNVQNVCVKLQDHANNLLQQISKLADGSVEVGIASYGLDGSGQPDVRVGFEGPLTGRATVPQSELAAGAIRVEEFEEEMSNGVGGLIRVKRKKPIYFDLEPTAGAPAAEAFAAIARMLADWCAGHPAACLPPVVLHLTRGRGEPAELEQALGQVRAIAAAAGPAVLYHLVATEAPHTSLAYPDTPEQLADPTLRKLWELTSPLLGGERLAAEYPVKADSRGMVVNGKFDLFLDEIKKTLATE
jgi:hypothetical protein